VPRYRRGHQEPDDHRADPGWCGGRAEDPPGRQGRAGDRGGPPGDLYVLVKVKEDALFGRYGDDLTLTVPITFPEAVNGVDLRVPR